MTPDGVFDIQLGFMTIDTHAESFLVLDRRRWCSSLSGGSPIKPLVTARSASMDRALLSNRTERLERRVEALSTSRADTVDFSAAELRRIERDLHDGAQARLVALGMSLGMADELMARDPEAARQTAGRGAHDDDGRARRPAQRRARHPPAGARRPRPRRRRPGAGHGHADPGDWSTSRSPARPPAPVESAAYFAVAECLANIGKHAGATRAWVTIGQRDDALQVEVGDDGRGGATPEPGTGVRGVVRRLSAFDGTLAVSSPEGGPTRRHRRHAADACPADAG